MDIRLGDVIRVDLLESEQLSRSRCSRFIGRIVTDNLSSEVVRRTVDTVSLHTRLVEAVQGDPEAISSVYTNANSAVVEAIYKKGHISSVTADVGFDGSISQYGQSLLDVHKNALKYTYKPEAYIKRLQVETLNTHRIEDLVRAGVLEDYYFFIPSLYPDDMTDSEARENGFFVNTKTNVLQLASTNNGQYTLESAFIEGDTDEADEKYSKVIEKLYSMFGFDISGISTTELLSTPILISKSLLPNGMIDLVRIQDEIRGNSFFGQKNIPISDYIEHAELCRDRESRLEQTTLDVVRELLLQNHIDSPIEAIQTLYDIVKDRVVKYAIKSSDIDAGVFGKEAKPFILAARNFLELGDTSGANIMINEALRAAIVEMCGIGNRKKNGNSADVQENDSNEVNTGQIKCIKCRKYVSKKEVVKVNSWCCPKCKYEVDICTGKILNNGKVNYVEDQSENNIFEIPKSKVGELKEAA